MLESNNGDLITWGQEKQKKNCIAIRKAHVAKIQPVAHSSRLSHINKKQQNQSAASIQLPAHLHVLGCSRHEIPQISTDIFPVPLRIQKAWIIPHWPWQEFAETVAMDQQTPDSLLASSKFFIHSNSGKDLFWDKAWIFSAHLPITSRNWATVPGTQPCT